MTNVFIKEAVNLRIILLLMVRIAGKKKASLLIVPLLAAMQTYVVNVNWKKFLIKVTTSHISHHLALDYHFPRVTVCPAND